MAKRRRSSSKRNGIILGVLLFLVVVVAGVFLFNNFTEQSAFPLSSQCYVVASDDDTTTTFSCDGAKCTVRVKDYCGGTPTGSDPIVVARAKNVQFGTTGHWVAVDDPADGFSQLTGYNRDTSSSRSGWANDRTWIKLPYGYWGFIVKQGTNSEIGLYVWQEPTGAVPPTVPGSGSFTYYRYKVGSGADTNPAASGANGECDIDEICSGDTARYTCTKDILKNNVKIATITYDKTTPGAYESNVINIVNGDTIYSAGSTIEWAVIDDTRACSVSQCNALGTGFYACSAGSCPQLSQTLTTCSQGEFCVQTGSGARCEIPFDVNVKFVDEEGQQVSGYAPSDTIRAEFTIDSESITTATAAIDLIDKQRNSLTTPVSKSLNFNNANRFTQTFTGQTVTKEYDVRVRLSFGSGSDAQTVERLFPVRVANEISLVTKAFSDRTGTTLFTNEPVTIQLRVFDLNQQLTFADTTVRAKLNGQDISSELGPRTAGGDVGEYNYLISIPDEGLLEITATATKFGFTQTQVDEFVVTPAGIRLELTNIANLKKGISPGQSYTVEIETKDPQGNPLTVSFIQAEIVRPGQAVGSGQKVTPTGGNGEYSFAFTPDAEGGWTLKVLAKAQGYADKETPPQLINVVAGGEVLECTGNAQCGFNQECKNNKCVEVTDGPGTSTIWIIALIALIILVSVIILIVKLTKKKTASSVDPSLLGGV